jgi:hypothetical protein
VYKYFSSEGDIKEQYRHLAMIYHPDRGGSEKIMKEINYEYSGLKNRVNENSCVSNKDNSSNNEVHNEEVFENAHLFKEIIEYANAYAKILEKDQVWAHPKDKQGPCLILLKLDTWKRWKDIKKQLNDRDYGEYLFLYHFYRAYWDDPQWLVSYSKKIFEDASKF